MIDDEAAWLRQHVDVLFEMDADERLTAVNVPNPEADVPRLFVARGRTSTLVRYRQDLSPPVAARLQRLTDALPPWDGTRPGSATYEPLRDVLRASGELADESHGPAFRFPRREGQIVGDDVILIDETNARLLDRHFPYTRSVLSWRSPVLAVVRDGAVVSACYSARRRPYACEAGVDTVEAYRGGGLAVAVVDAWARAAEAAGMTPLYSTSWDNAPSRRVAAKLGLVAYGDTLSLM